MTAEQAFPAVKMLIQQVQDSGERLKLENLILGAVESKERRKARISAQLEKKERFRIKPKTKNQLKNQLKNQSNDSLFFNQTFRKSKKLQSKANQRF